MQARLTRRRLTFREILSLVIHNLVPRNATWVFLDSVLLDIREDLRLSMAA